MKTTRSRIFFILGGVFASLIFIGIGGIILVPSLQTMLVEGNLLRLHPPTPLEQVEQAWSRARQSGSYQFSADVLQKTVPLPIVANIGRQSQEEAMYIEGQASFPGQKMELAIWQGGSSTHNQDDALQLRLENGKAQRRQPGGEWEALQEYSSLYAPEGDMLAYLGAARQVSDLGSQAWNGVTYRRYAFQIDGPAFARRLRDQMQQRMQASGELPASMSLDLPKIYAEMDGEGELWVDEGGYPARQRVYLRFADTSSDSVEARIHVTFSGYASLPGQASAISPIAQLISSEGMRQGVVFLLFVMVFLVLLAFRRSKSIYASVVVLVVVSMLVTPLLESAQARVFTDRQIAQRQESEARQQDEQAFESLRQKLEARTGASLAQELGKSSQAGSPEAASFLASMGLEDVALADQPQAKLLEENGEDSDSDGLTDFVEQSLGTDPQDADTDGDTVKDGVEVRGFTYNGRRWYTDPLSFDSNSDGTPDLYEYADPLNGIPLDANQDGIPDASTDDDDGDGVPDARDLSPSQSTRNEAAFSRSRPLVLKIDNLQSNKPTYVEFQLRPLNQDHLWYAQNVLDWPIDRQGQIQDDDGVTYADKYGTSGNAENGDMKLIPLLEISSSGSPDNLPAKSTLEGLYGISTIQRSQALGEKAVYVPLQPVVASNGGGRLAFYGKMLYDPKGSWNNQEVRLVWLVQALLDTCETYDEKTDLCIAYSARNEPRIVQAYYDDWYLTGLNIQENLGYTQGVIWEDPQVDSDRLSDDLLTLLTYQLDRTFMTGNDANNDDQPDITIDEIQRRFDRLSNNQVPDLKRWNIPDGLRVYAGDFSHADEGQSALAKETLSHPSYYQILESNFRPLVDAGETVTPTLLILSEERSSSVNLDDISTGAAAWNDSLLSVDFERQGSSNIPLVVTERWQSYCVDGEGWTPLSVEQQWDEMERRFSLLYQGEPDPAVADRKRLLLNYYNLALYNTQSNVIGKDYHVSIDLETVDDTGQASLTDQIINSVEEAIGTRLFRRAARELVKDLGSRIKPEWFSDSPATDAEKIKTYRNWGMGIEAAVFGINLLTSFLEPVIGEDAVRIINAGGNFALAGALIADDLLGGYKAFAALKDVADLGTSARLWKFASKVDVKASCSGFIIDLIVIWGLFGLQYGLGGGEDMSAYQLHSLLANAFATTLIVLAVFLISLATGNIVAVILEIIMLIIDAFLMIFGKPTISEHFAKLFHGWSMVASPDVQILNTALAQDPVLGLVAPSTVKFTLSLNEAAVNQDPDNWLTKASNEYYMPDTLRTTAVKTTLTITGTAAATAAVVHGTMNDDWWVSEDHKFTFGGLGITKELPMYRAEKYWDTTYSRDIPLTKPGINLALPVYLNLGYDLPYVSCMYYVVWVDCQLDYQAGTTTLPLGDSIIMDVLPATLDGFYSLLSPVQTNPLAKNSGLAPARAAASATGYQLGWDERFPVLKDADGDGLLSAAYGGPDPDDRYWDTDGDGLSDAFEFERRQMYGSEEATSLLSADTDYDGLCDDQEIRLGTHPNRGDSDGDGLLDSQEVFHQVRCGSEVGWAGGWDYSVEGLSTRLTSDPLNPDTDGDGLDDKAEFTLGENPRAWTENPMLLTAAVDDQDRIVAPGQTLAYTVTVQNDITSQVPLYCLGDLSVGLPAPLSGVALTATLNIPQGMSQSFQREVSVDSTAPSAQLDIANSFAGQMNDGDLNTYWTLSQAGNPGLPVAYAAYGGFPPYASLAAYPNPTLDSTYALVELARAGEESQARVNFRQLVDAFSQPADLYASDKRFPRRFLGSYPPGLACNSAGRCLTLWERARYYDTAVLHLDEILLTTSGNIDGADDHSAEVEFWGYVGRWVSKVFSLSWNFGPENTTGYLFYRGPTKPTNYQVLTYLQGNREVNPCPAGQSCTYGWRFNINSGATFSIVEEDCNWLGCQHDGSGPNYTFQDFNRYHPTWNSTYFHDLYIDTQGDPDGWADVGLTAFYEYGDGIYASVVNPSRASVSGIKAVSEVEANKGNWFGQPAAASDGVNFLAVYARRYLDYSGFPNIQLRNGLFSQVLDANGNLVGSARLISNTAVSFEKSFPKVIWMEQAQRYLVIWSDGGTRAALLDQAGVVQWQGILSGSAVDQIEQVPDVAYNSSNGTALLVYTQDNRLYRLRLEVQGEALAWGLPQEIQRLTPSSSLITWLSVAYEPFSGGWAVSWTDRAAGDYSWLSYLFLDDQGQVLQHKEGLGEPASFSDIQAQTFGNFRQQDLACKRLTSTSEVGHCAISGLVGNQVHQSLYAQTFTMAKISPFLGSCNPPAASLSLWVDGMAPDVSVALQDGAAYAFDGIVTIGGEADDHGAVLSNGGEVAAGVESVWVSTDHRLTWQRAEGAEAWAYNWSVPAEDGEVTLWLKARDKLGNETPEAAMTSVTIQIDRSAPGELALVAPADANPVQAIQDGTSLWQLPLVIHATEQDGSPVAAVSVSLEPLGSGWREAVSSDGVNWTLDYPLSPLDPVKGGVADPTGAYTVRLSARDGAGNSRELTVPYLVQVDNTPPEVTLTYPNESSLVITQAVDATGVISDTGKVTTPVSQVEVAITPAGADPASWIAVAPDDPEAAISTWHVPLPVDQDGLYQIWLRGRDRLGNQGQAVLGGQLVFEIDALNPEATCSLDYRGAGSAAQTAYSASAQDFNLSEAATGLLDPGTQALLPVQFAQKSFYDDPWYLQVISDTARLNRLEFSGVINGHVPLAFIAVDLRGHSVQVNCPVNPAAPPELSSSVKSPANGAAITSEDSILIQGGANASAGLASLSLTANGQEIFSTSWEEPRPIDAVWSASWLPAADGIYTLVPVVTDANGQVQTELQPVVVTVDRQPPLVTLDTDQLNRDDRISHNRVWLTGTASDNLGLEGVEVSADNGLTWKLASLVGTSWRFAWSAGDPHAGELDGVALPVSIRAVDQAGLSTRIDPTVTVDLQAPAPVTLTLTAEVAPGLRLLEPGATVRENTPTLTISWTASSDGGSAVGYWAGWSPEQTVGQEDLHQVDGFQLSETIETDLQVLYAHLIVRDAAGNELHQVAGPVYIDFPGPPDLVSDLDYRGWLDDACNLVGVDYEVSHYAAAEASLSNPQKLYASWDAADLRLTYSGAFWDQDGDLLIYLDTIPGAGAAQAFDPYGSGPAIQLPAGFGADILVFVEDSQSARLLTWNGSSWTGDSLPEGQFHYDATAPGYTDLLLPWDALGNPGAFNLLALASEEDRLRLWAALPESNPLNSGRAVDILAALYLDQPFTLRRYLTLDRAAACPNGGLAAGADLHFSLSAAPNGAVAGYLADDLTSLLNPTDWLDDDLDGLADQDLPVDMSSAWVGEGGSIVYTLTYTNTGTISAEGVTANLATHGLQLTGGDTLDIGTVEAGAGGERAIPATLLNGVLSGELRLEISDARQGAFEWLWSLHRVDKEPPQGVTIETPALYVRPGPNRISGRAHDPSGVASVSLAVTPPGALEGCQPPAIGEDRWTCTWTPPSGSPTFQAQAQATDVFDNVSPWSEARTWTLDEAPPVVTLSPETYTALQTDKILLPADLVLTGNITDNFAVGALEVCAVAADSPGEICEWAELAPGGAPSAAWEVLAPIAGLVDGILHTLSITGYDAAGNPSAVLTYQDLYVDLAGPTITIAEYHPSVLQAQQVTMLSGSVRDASGVESLSVRLTDPSGSVTVHACTAGVTPGKLCTLTGGSAQAGYTWEFSASLDESGRYTLIPEATDLYGNKSLPGSWVVQVVPRLNASDLALELAASAATAISGFPLTYTATVYNAGPGIAAGITLTATLPAAVDLDSAPGYCQASDHTLVCSVLDPLLQDSSLLVQFTVDVPMAVTTTLTLEAQVSSVTIDLQMENNHRLVNTPVIQPIAGLSVTSDGPTPLGADTTFTATVTQGYPVSFQWDFGDGNTADGAVVSHYYASHGVYTATVTAINDYNQVSASIQVGVINLPPEVNTLGLDQLTYEDELTWTGYIHYTDPNIADLHTASIEWGDGSSSAPDEIIPAEYGGMLLGAHIFADPGVYTVTVTVQDAYGGLGTGSFPITVLHGFMRLCAYAAGQDPGGTIYPQARLDCPWTQADALARAYASGLGSRGYIQVEAGAVISGNLRSQGDTLISGEDVRLIGGQLEREFDQVATGNIDSQGKVELGVRADIARHIASRLDVLLREQGFVGGDVTANGKVTAHPSAVVSGTITERANLPDVPPFTMVTLSFTSGWEDVSVAQGAVLALEPGRYRHLTVKKGATLMLKAGWYTFESITLEQNVTLALDLAREALLVDVVKNVFMGEGARMVITSSSGAADKILFRVMGNTVYLMKGGVYLGTFLAPSGQVRLGEDARLTGAMYGKSVHVMDRARVTGMPARNLFAITMVNPDLPLGCEDRVTCSWSFVPIVIK